MPNENPPARPGAAPSPALDPLSSAAAEAAPGPAGPERELGFDQVLERLRQVVARLEQGSLSLEQALVAFEDGVRLSRRGGEILDQAEQRVELLLRGEEGERRQPLQSPAPAPGHAP
jgi:exodeoxyribonuclease VII small subunit